MNPAVQDFPSADSHTRQRYQRAIEVSRRVRWDIERDVIRGRGLDAGRRFMPEGLSRVSEAGFLSEAEMRFLSQVQGRTYANFFAAVEEHIGRKLAELSNEHRHLDPVACEALAGFTEEELKHQELFRRIERLAAAGMPPGYRFKPDAGAMAQAILSKSTWAVLGFTLMIEIYTQVHYLSSIQRDTDLCPLWKDVFLFHWKEEAQHAILDELEWRREDGLVGAEVRDHGVDELIELVRAVDHTVTVQAAADAQYFITAAGRDFTPDEARAIQELLVRAYRWQYIASGAREPRFLQVLGSLVAPAQQRRFESALAPIVKACDRRN